MNLKKKLTSSVWPFVRPGLGDFSLPFFLDSFLPWIPLILDFSTKSRKASSKSLTSNDLWTRRSEWLRWSQQWLVMEPFPVLRLWCTGDWGLTIVLVSVWVFLLDLNAFLSLGTPKLFCGFKSWGFGPLDILPFCFFLLGSFWLHLDKLLRRQPVGHVDCLKISVYLRLWFGVQMESPEKFTHSV